METVVLSDLIGVSDPGRSAIRALTNSKPVGRIPSTSDFSAETRPVKLNYEHSRFGSSNPAADKTRQESSAKHRFLNPNDKMKGFKEQLKLAKSVPSMEGVNSTGTGLFSFADLTSPRKGHKANPPAINSEIGGAGIQSIPHDKPVSGKAGLPKSILKNKTKKLDIDIHQRINKAFHSIESLGKDFSVFDKTLKAATERAVADGRLSRKLLANSLQPRDGALTSRTSTSRSKPQGVVIDVTRPIKKVFGLDTSQVLRSSTSEDTDGTDRGRPELTKKISFSNKPTPRRRRKKSFRKNTTIGSGSTSNPTIAKISDRRFLARREKQRNFNKDIAEIRSQLEVMDKKNDREARNANVTRNKTNFQQRPNNFTRIMAYNPKEGTGRELTDFLQSSGGLYGGWDPEDHNTFLRLYYKWKSRPSRVIDLVKTEVGGKKVEEIAGHISWFEKYETLNNANKTYIRQWQIAKRREKEELYRIAKDEQLASLEAEKRKHEILKSQRDDERDKNKLKLKEWKSSLALEKKMMRINADLIREPDNENRINKLQEAMENIKKGFSNMQPKHPEARKFFSSKKIVPIVHNKYGGSPSSMRSVSSGVFSDGGQGDDNQSETSEYDVGLNRSMADSAFSSKRISVVGFEHPNPDTGHSGTISASTPKSGKLSSRTIRENYQARDANMVESRRLAIEAKLEEKRNKSFLTSEQIKQRVGKIEVPSKVLDSTKVWTSRRETKDAENLENRQIQAKDRLDQHNASRVPAPQMFKPSTSVRLIPKLATPGWRKF